MDTRDVPRFQLQSDARLSHHFREPQKRIGVFSLEHFLASRALLWARMHKSRLPKRLMRSWIAEPRVAGGQEMTHDRSLQHHLAHFDLSMAFTKRAPLAQDRTELHKPVTELLLTLRKHFVRKLRGDTRVTLKDKQRLAEQRADEIAKRRADFNATNN